MKKIYFDLIFIVLASVLLTITISTGLLEKYLGFALIPLLMSYYLGQLVQKNAKNK